MIMLVPLAGSAFFLFRALETYPQDVATAAASSARQGARRSRVESGR
jgi:hypothetical protein